MKTKLYKESTGTIHQKVRAFSKRYPIEYDEILSEANLIFCEAIETYDEEKSKFNTYLTNELKYKLNIFCKKVITNYNLTSHYVPEIAYIEKYVERAIFNSTLDKISTQEKEVMDLILNARDNNSKVSRNSIRNELLLNGWSGCQVEKSFKTIVREFELV